MDIIKHITEGLYSNQEIVIPGFGKFIGERKPAYVSEGKIHPPSKKISFVRDTNSFVLDLAIRIASKERVTEDEAAKTIKEFVKIANEKLKNGQSVVFDGIGIIAPTPDGKFLFHQSQQANLLPETFGMEAVELSGGAPNPKTVSQKKKAAQKRRPAPPRKKASRKKMATTVPKEKNDDDKKGSGLAWLWWMFAFFAIVAIAIGVWWMYFDGKTQYAKLMDSYFPQEKNIVVIDSAKIKAAQDSARLKAMQDSIRLAEAEKEAAMKRAPSKITNENDVSEAFETHIRNNTLIYLIAGSFKDQDNARQYVKRLQSEGYDSEILNAENGFYRVTIGKFPDAPRAMQVFNSFTKRYPKTEIWAL